MDNLQVKEPVYNHGDNESHHKDQHEDPGSNHIKKILSKVLKQIS